MTFLEASALLQDQTFVNRVRVSISKQMDECLGCDPEDEDYENDMLHTQRVMWNFEAEVSRVMQVLIGQPAVLSAASGSSVTDEVLAETVKGILTELQNAYRFVPPAPPSVMFGMVPQPQVTYPPGLEPGNTTNTSVTRIGDVEEKQ